MEDEPIILLPDGRRWQQLRGCRGVLCARQMDEVLSVISQAEEEAVRGRIAAGFVSYEAAPAFDAALITRAPGPLPLAWFAIFEEGTPELPGAATLELPPGKPPAWSPAVPAAAYSDAVAAIRDAIARGETYQVNFTFPFLSGDPGDPLPLFLRLAAAQRGAYGMFIATEDFAICSASPELFFELDNNVIRCRPMKGTASRGRWPAEDDAAATALRESAKNRAENLMIADMVRNDLGRIAETGSVRTTSLFDIERYPTVLQMTSTIEARTTASVTGVFRALFPSASITGAPKVRTSRIIAGLETQPRGVYCGAVGCMGPGRRAKFNVAIRTVEIDRKTSRATFGTGSGIVWDSDAKSEYAESLSKAAVLSAPPWPEFHLLETMRFDVSNGWKFRDEHLARLAASARYFGYRFDEGAARAALDRAAADDGGAEGLRARLLLGETGAVVVEKGSLRLPGFFEERPATTIPFIRAAISHSSVNSRDVFLFHKTTHRAAYDKARAACPGVEEVLLVNELDQLTEGTIGNIVLQMGDELLTPALDCGLLPGIFRQHLLKRGVIREAVLTPYDMHRAHAAYLVNSVRGWSRLAMRG